MAVLAAVLAVAVEEVEDEEEHSSKPRDRELEKRRQIRRWCSWVKFGLLRFLC
jgi:hypothetical protein